MDTITPQRQFKGVWIPACIWLDSSLTWLHKCILAEIDSLGNDENPCIASDEYLATMFGISTNRMAHYVGDLKRRGYLKRASFDGRIRGLVVCFNPSSGNRAELSDSDSSQLSKTDSSKKPSIIRIGTSIDTSPPNPPKGGVGGQGDLGIEVEDQRPRLSGAVLPDALNLPEFISAWESYVSYRKQRRLPHLLPISVEKQFRRFVQWGVKVAIAQIELTIGNGYQGIIDPPQIYGNRQTIPGVAERRVNRNLGNSNQGLDPGRHARNSRVVRA